MKKTCLQYIEKELSNQKLFNIEDEKINVSYACRPCCLRVLRKFSIPYYGI